MNIFDIEFERNREYEERIERKRKENTIILGCSEEEANYIAHFKSYWVYPYILRAKTYREVLMLIKSKTNYTNGDWKWSISKRCKENKRSKSPFSFSYWGWYDFSIILGDQVWNGRQGQGDDGTLDDYLFDRIEGRY